MPYLNHLDISGLKSVSFNLFSQTPNLRSLVVQNVVTYGEELMSSIAHLIFLENLDLSDTAVPFMTEGDFLPRSSLKWLNASLTSARTNLIPSLKFEILTLVSKFPNVEVLDLSGWDFKDKDPIVNKILYKKLLNIRQLFI